jgi:hypothetical protein
MFIVWMFEIVSPSDAILTANKAFRQTNCYPHNTPRCSPRNKSANQTADKPLKLGGTVHKRWLASKVCRDSRPPCHERIV